MKTSKDKLIVNCINLLSPHTICSRWRSPRDLVERKMEFCRILQACWWLAKPQPQGSRRAGFIRAARRQTATHENEGSGPGHPRLEYSVTNDCPARNLSPRCEGQTQRFFSSLVPETQRLLHVFDPGTILSFPTGWFSSVSFRSPIKPQIDLTCGRT